MDSARILLPLSYSLVVFYFVDQYGDKPEVDPEFTTRYAVLKVAPIILLLLAALLVPGTSQPHRQSRVYICLGLVCSIAGDIVLAQPYDTFLLGLITFALAQVFYIKAFSNGINGESSAGLACMVFGMLWWGSLVKYCSWLFVVAGAFYVLLIMTMAWMATSRWNLDSNISNTYALIGAYSFVISDILVSLNRGADISFNYQGLLTMLMYYLAQIFIVHHIIAYDRKYVFFSPNDQGNCNKDT